MALKKTFWGDGIVLCQDWDYSHATAYIYKNSSNSAFKQVNFVECKLCLIETKNLCEHICCYQNSVGKQILSKLHGNKNTIVRIGKKEKGQLVNASERTEP